MAKTVGSASPNKASHEEIAQRARAIYERSGCVPGKDVENWLQAEAELSAARQVAQREQGKPAAKTNSRTSNTRMPSSSGSYA